MVDMTRTHSPGAVRRPYHSPARRRQAEQTRQRILAAARELFRTLGYAATTMEAIASSAQVATKTVEAASSKRGLLVAVVDPLASAGPPRDLVERVRAATDQGERLRLVCRTGPAGLSGGAPELELMRGAAAVTPEVATAARQVDSRRHADQARLVAYLAEHRVLRQDLDPGQATDIVWALTSYDLYRALVTGRRWPEERYQDWLAGTLAACLLRP